MIDIIFMRSIAKKTTILSIILLFPLMMQAQDQNEPYVRFDQGSILFYSPSQGGQRLLPDCKPGFVHILMTPGSLVQVPRGLSDRMAASLRHLTSKPMSSNQKTEFLEKYACLILLNYSRISQLDTLFYTTARSLQKDPGLEVSRNAAAVVKMAEMYMEKEP